VSETQRRLLARLQGLNEVAIDVERVAVLLQALGALLDRGEGWEEFAASYRGSPRVQSVCWPDGQLVRPWVEQELQAVAVMLERLQLLASLAVMQREAPGA
jgi:hypothetical protein